MLIIIIYNIVPILPYVDVAVHGNAIKSVLWDNTLIGARQTINICRCGLGAHHPPPPTPAMLLLAPMIIIIIIGYMHVHVDTWFSGQFMEFNYSYSTYRN